METMQAIRSRRSVRKFLDKAIGAEEEKILLEAGMCAPSAHGCRPWRFLVVREKGSLIGISERHPYAKMCEKAAMAIVVCADPSASKAPDFWPQDCSAATENILLAARSMELGAVWVSGHPIAERTEPIKALLGIPPGIQLFCVIALGWPAEHPEIKPRYEESYVHRNKW